MFAHDRQVERGWRRLWCISQATREPAAQTDWNHLEMNAIGSAWGRDRSRLLTSGLGFGVDPWSATIVAELTR